ncbi:MAG: hypothetical protein K8M05_06590 [Deltaproteobacteria bacterium]|nr:hypothetical protein [Kofleriaceae bacterium]
MRPVLPLTLAASAAVSGVAVACQAKSPPRAVEVVLRDAGDAPVLTLVRTAVGCTAEPGALVFTANGNVTSGNGFTFGPGPAGPELRGASGTIARVVTDQGPPRRLSIIDPIGVPMVRMTFAADGVTAVDAARAPVGRIEHAPDGLRFVAANDDATNVKGGLVTGAGDVALPDRFTIAAPLLAPAPLALPARALLACERLAALTPSVK